MWYFVCPVCELVFNTVDPDRTYAFLTPEKAAEHREKYHKEFGTSIYILKELS